MAVKLDDRPDESLYDDGNPSWRTNMQGLEDQFDAPSASDADLPEGHPSRSDSKNLDLANRENQGAGTLPGSNAIQKEKAGVANAVGGGAASWATNLAAARARPLTWIANNPKKSAVGGGVIGTILGLFIGGSIIISGPAQLIHAANLLSNLNFTGNEETSDRRRNNIMFYANYARGNASRNNLGAIGNKLADKYDNMLKERGIIQDRANRRSVQHIDIDTNTEAGRNLDARLRANPDIDIGVPDENGIVRVNTRGSGSTKATRITIDEMVNELGLKGKSAEVAKYVLRARNGVRFKMTNILREKGEDVEDYRKRNKEERAKQAKEGAEDINSNKPEAGKDDTNNDGTGDTDNPDNNAAAKNSGEVLDDIDGADVTTLEGQGKIRQAKIKLTQKLGPVGAAAAGAAAVVGLSCAAKDIGDEAEKAQYINNILPMIRMAFDILSAGGQIAAGDADLDQIGAIVDDMQDDLASPEKRSFFNAQTLRADQSGDPNAKGVPPPDNANPGFLGKKPVVLDVLDRIPGLSFACDISKEVSKLPVIKQAGDAQNAIINAGLETVTGKSLDDFVGMLVDFVAGNGVNVLAQGAEMGNLVTTGAFLASNEQALSMGGRALTGQETAELREFEREELRRENAQQPMFARIFSPTNPHSLVAKNIIGNPSFGSISASSQTLLDAPTSIFTNIGNIISPRAYAAAGTGYDYGVPRYGFSLAELEDERVANPFANAEVVEPKLAELTEEYGECFNVKIENGVFTQSEGTSYAEIPDKCNGNDEMLLRFRMYILDFVTAKALACYESIDEKACSELGATGSQGSTQASTQSGNPNLYMIGDSISVGLRTVGIAQKFKDKGWQDVCLEAEESRPLGASELTETLANNGEAPIDCRGKPAKKTKGLTQINQSPDKEAIANAGTVVIALGTNDGLSANTSFRDNVKKMIEGVRAINPQVNIKWVNVYLKPGKVYSGYKPADFDKMNQILGEMSKELNFTIIDWNSVAADKYSDKDGIHPANYPAMADYIVEQVGVPTAPSAAASGDRQQLAQQILDSGKVEGDDRYMGQIRAIAAGDFSCNINPQILKIIATAAQKHTLRVSSINRACTGVVIGAGKQSRHWINGGGHAVDISIVDGQVANGNTAQERALIATVRDLLIPGSGVGQSGCRQTPMDVPEGVSQFPDSCNHTHIQVPVQ